MLISLDDGRGPPRRGDRYDDRRGPAGGGGNWRRRDDDYYRYGRYDSYNDRREYGRDYGRGEGRGEGRGDGGYRRDYGGGRDYRRDSRDDHGYRGGGGAGGPDRYGDRYSREDRRGGDDRRGGASAAPAGAEGAASEGRGYYERDANPPSYDAAPPREPREPYSGGGGRSYEGRGGEDRYASR